MDYTLSIPDIYNYAKTKNIENTGDKFTVKFLSLNLLPNVFYDLDEDNNFVKIVKQNNKQNDTQFDFYNLLDHNKKRIYAFYFKTNTHKIILRTNGNNTYIHNNLLYFNINNRRTDNDYILYNSNDMEQYIEVYIIYKIDHRSELISTNNYLYDKTTINKLTDLFYSIITLDRWGIKYHAHYNDAMQTWELMLNFYVKTKNNELNEMVRFESNNIIFYFKYNYKYKLTNTKYLYKYNLVKLENKNNNREYICEMNNSKLNDINSVKNYLENIDYIYYKIFSVLDIPKYEYYFLDFKTFMIKNDIDEIYYTKIYYDV